MFTNPFTTRLAPLRRKARRRAMLRRGWLVQRLEQRCVMAADFLGSGGMDGTAENPHAKELAEGVPSLVSSIRFTAPADDYDQLVFSEPEVPLNMESHNEVDDNSVHESIVFIDLLAARSIEMDIEQHASLVFTWDASQLDRLLAGSDSLAVHVLFDTSRWQAPLGQQPADEFDFAAREAAADVAHPLLDSTLTMQSLADQSVRVQIDVQPGNVDEGTQTQIIIKLTDTVGAQAADQKWTTEDFDLMGGNREPETSPLNNRMDMHESLVEGVLDPALIVDSTKQSDTGYASPGTAVIGEETGEAQPLSDNDATPLPESRREATDRNVRSVRRTLDLRSTVAVSSTAPLTTRAAVTPNSMATQTAIASVYEADAPIASTSSRWMLDPQPARLQVATFLISRSQHNQSAVAASAHKPVNAAENHASETANELASATAVIDDSVDAESLTRVATLPTVEEITAVQLQENRQAETLNELDDESIRETPVYASIVDRLLGSPVSLVAVLGLTAIARFADPEYGGEGSKTLRV